MRAALLEAPGRPLRIVDDLEIEEPRGGEVRVRVAHCGVCHSDLSIVDGVFPAPLPIVLGHEAAGVVDAVGPGVVGLAPGQPVVLTACPPCGRCYWCVRGEAALCVNGQGIATNTLPDGRTGLSRGGRIVYRGVNLSARRLLGTLLGNCNSLHEIPRLVSLWQAGRLDLEGLITARRPLEQINQALDDLRASRGIRTVLSL